MFFFHFCLFSFAVESPHKQMASVVISAKGKSPLPQLSQPATQKAPTQPTKTELKKQKKELKQQASVESMTSTSTTATANSGIANEKASKKSNAVETPASQPVAANKKAKGSRKQSNEDPRGEAESKKIVLDNAKLTKAAIEASEQLKDHKKKGKKGTSSEQNDIDTSTSKPAGDKAKKEKKKIKYEYADPNYKVNKFDLLLDDDEDDDEYYMESSSEEEVVEPAPVVVKPVAPAKQEATLPATKSAMAKTANGTKDAGSKKAAISANTKPPAAKVEKAPQKIVLKAEPTPVPVVPVRPPTPEVPVLSKRQQKKLLQKQKLEEKLAMERAGAELAAARSLTDSMSRLQLNTDHSAQYAHTSMSNQTSFNVSIMDQLNRGVNVERLTLPPGITLTRVDPAIAETLRAKKQSIEKLVHTAPTQPPSQQVPEYSRPPHYYLNGPTPMTNPNQNPNGFIMVDPLHSAAGSQPQPDSAATSKKSKRNKKKKNKNAETAESTTNPKMVTLRNPLFQTAAPNPMPSNMAGLQDNSALPFNINTAASIIKNENGMYTIRNTALHQSLSNGMGSNFRPYSADMYPPMDPTANAQLAASQAPLPPQHAPGSFSYFSDGMSGSNTKPMNDLTSAPPVSSQQTAIGSEIKSAQQMKSMPWNGAVISKSTSSTAAGGTINANGDLFNKMSHLNPQQTRSYSPFDPMPSYGFNSDFIGSSPTPHSQPSTSSYYSNSNGSNYTGASTYSHDDSNSLFSGGSSSLHRGSHRCDDSPPLHDVNQYYNNGMTPSYFNKYDDLGRLQAGHRLNSEVTIHSVADANFHRDQVQSLLTNGVEITRITAPTKSPAEIAFDGANPNLAVGSHRHSAKGHDMANPAAEYGGKYIMPLLTLNRWHAICVQTSN